MHKKERDMPQIHQASSKQASPLSKADPGTAKKEAQVSTDCTVQEEQRFPQAALSELQPHLRERALDEFAFALRMHFDRNNREIKSREAVMKKVGNAVERSFDTRQYDMFLETLFHEGYLRIDSRTLVELADKVKSKFNVPFVAVVSGERDDRFAHVAAEVFIKEIARIGSAARKRETAEKPAEICIGIVSGTTDQKVIERATKLNWLEDCGVNPRTLPDVKVFAINTCLVHPDKIESNATILASRLAATINESCGAHQRRAKAYGLNAPVFVEKEKLSGIDQEVQNKEVLKHTEPHRVRSSDGKEVAKTETSLDIILTSVGELGDGDDSGSMFYRLARSVIPNMDEFARETRLVGDLAYNPLSSVGEEVVLVDSVHKQQIVFYSAASLAIFSSVATNPCKSVILVAQDKQGKKIPVIYASLRGGLTAGRQPRRYVSHLIIDEQTAGDLLRY
jgi:DNA-binding transcriptional regulator LsrR (DeoR family)